MDFEDIGLYLALLRSDLSLVKLQAFLPIASNEKQMRLAINDIRLILNEHIVVQHLGIKNIGRKSLIEEHTTSMSQILFRADNETLITIWDATYIYTENSSDHQINKDTYSMHKSRPLYKFMIVCATDGYIVDAIGPYKANARNNDASIMNSIICDKKYNFINESYEDDIFVVDRGFRDSKEIVESTGIK